MELLKDQLFNEDTISVLFNKLSKVTKFNTKKATKRALEEFPSLELKERITSLTRILYDMLPKDFEETIQIFDSLVSNVKESLFVYGALLEYLETYGCKDEYYKLSLSRMGVYTRAFSAEFAIRAFINNYQEETYKHVKEWARSENVDTRRLASEGTRPLLPWAKKIHADHALAIEWLSILVHDTDRYVTRSVANHLNDISKFDPDLVIQTLLKWKHLRTDSEMDYIVKHSLRTLIKQGNSDALELLGFKKNPSVLIDAFNFETDTFYIGEKVYFNFNVLFSEDVKVLVDYVLWFQSKSGRPSKKVYKLTTLQGRKDEMSVISGRVDLTQRTTRKIYPGVHKIDIQVNGDILYSSEFTVEEKVN